MVYCIIHLLTCREKNNWLSAFLSDGKLMAHFKCCEVYNDATVTVVCYPPLHNMVVILHHIIVKLHHILLLL